MQEHLQLVLADKTRSVGDDRAEEALVLLVAAQLGLAVILAGNQYRIQHDVLSQDVHLRGETQLPPAVKHVLGDCNKETQVDLAVPLGDIPEAGGHDGGLDNVCGHHLSILVPYRPHDHHLASVRGLHLERVPVRLEVSG